MVKVTIDIPDEVSFLQEGISEKELAFLATKDLQKKLRKIARFRKIISKSKATERDVDELTDKVNTAIWKHHNQKYGL